MTVYESLGRITQKLVDEYSYEMFLYLSVMTN